MKSMSAKHKGLGPRHTTRLEVHDGAMTEMPSDRTLEDEYTPGQIGQFYGWRTALELTENEVLGISDGVLTNHVYDLRVLVKILV